MSDYLPVGWSIKKSSEFCLRVADGTHDTPKPVREGRPLITSRNLKAGKVNFDGAYLISESDYQQVNKRSKVDRWDVLFSMIGTVGEIALIRAEPNFAIKNIGLFKNKTRKDGLWLYYYLSSSIGQAALDTFLSGTSQQFVALGDLRKVPVIVPSDGTKKKVGAILSAYDELIEINNRRIALLETMAEEIYREWFVRLRFPGHKKAEFIKGVPKKWDNTTFGKFCMLKRGYDLPDKSVAAGNYPVIASTSVKAYHNEFKVMPPVITTGRSGSLGFVLMVNCKAWPLNTTLYVKNFFGNSPYLIFYTLKNMGLENFNSGAGVPTLNRNHINGIKIVVPDKDLQKRFDSVVAPFHERKELLTKANAVLERARASLLPRLISGKLSVENLDIRFPPGMADEIEAEPVALAHA